MNRIITINRQFCSGGKEIGMALAKKLGIPVYNKELILKIAEKSGLSAKYVKNYGELSASLSWFNNILADRDYNGHSLRDDVWQIQTEIITELAQKESCVIIGRCADQILKEKADLLKVFVHSSMEDRIERLLRLYGERKETPEKRLIEKDKKRKSYYQFNTECDWDNATNYDITLDSGKLGIQKCVEILADLY